MTAEHHLHERVLALWRTALGLPDLASDENFFSSGGNSMVALRLNKRLGDEFGRKLPLRALFENSTASAYSDWLSGALQQAG